jgi:hypothetical protein
MSVGDEDEFVQAPHGATIRERRRFRLSLQINDGLFAGVAADLYILKTNDHFREF